MPDLPINRALTPRRRLVRRVPLPIEASPEVTAGSLGGGGSWRLHCGNLGNPHTDPCSAFEDRSRHLRCARVALVDRYEMDQIGALVLKGVPVVILYIHKKGITGDRARVYCLFMPEEVKKHVV